MNWHVLPLHFIWSIEKVMRTIGLILLDHITWLEDQRSFLRDPLSDRDCHSHSIVLHWAWAGNRERMPHTLYTTLIPTDSYGKTSRHVDCSSMITSWFNVRLHGESHRLQLLYKIVSFRYHLYFIYSSVWDPVTKNYYLCKQWFHTFIVGCCHKECAIFYFWNMISLILCLGARNH